MKAARRCAVMVLVGMAAQAGAMQPNPWPVKEPAADLLPADAPGLSPQAVVEVFRQACIDTEGDAAGALDWALVQGFEPMDPGSGSADEVMAGMPATVLVAPGSAGRVLLAVANGGPCTVWAQRMPGPPVRLALAALMGQLATQGAKVQSLAERTVDRAGTWRQQTQWRYRRVGGSGEFGVGAVTTLQGDAPGTQLLHLAPLEARSNFDPDGQVTRR